MKTMVLVGVINRYPAPEGWQYIHVDAGDRGIWDAQAGGNVPIDVRADMRDLPFGDGTIDRVQAWHSLEHVGEQGGRDALAEWARILKPGGVLDVKVPDMLVAAHDLCHGHVRDFLRRVYGDQTPMPDADLNVHRWGYVTGTLRLALAEAGFKPGLDLGPGPDGDEIHFEAVLREP